MNRGDVFSLFAIAVCGSVLLPGSVVSQQTSLKEQIIGTWSFVSALDVKQDGTKSDRWGQNPKGILVFDSNGHYSLTIMRSDLPKFAAKTADQGNADENKAVLQGMITHFGTYSLNEADKTLTTRIEGSSFPNLVGTEQKRTIASLTADELKYTNPATATGTRAEASWKRAK
jgi:Lipocalin-like domain